MKGVRFSISRCQQCGYWDSFVKCCDYLKIEHKPRPCKPTTPDDPTCTVWTDQKFVKTPRGRIKTPESEKYKEPPKKFQDPIYEVSDEDDVLFGEDGKTSAAPIGAVWDDEFDVLLDEKSPETVNGWDTRDTKKQNDEFTYMDGYVGSLGFDDNDDEI